MGLIFLRNRVSGVAPFDPASLFASGEEGVWYEPSTTTAFRSTTDLTPCDYGQSCGFLLDKSQGAGYSGGSFTGLGSELVTNGDFATGDITGWTEYLPANGDVSVSGQKVTITKTSSSAHGLYQDLTATSGAWHLLRFDVTSLTATTGFAVYGSGFTILELNGTNFLPAAKTYEYLFFASTSTPRIYFVAANGGSVTLDNISVRELPGNHAVQNTESARPILARIPVTGRRNLLTGTDDLSTQSVTVTAVEHVLSFTGTGTVTLTGAITAGPLVGTGASDRVDLTFTPSAGSLTLTVLGEVNFAQLEIV